MIVRLILLSKPVKLLLKITLVLLCSVTQTEAQNYLDQPITVNFSQTRLADALSEIGKKGGFYFSYNGKLFSKDSLITCSATNQRISELLSKLFQDKYEYEERKNYVIITASLPHLLLVNTDITNDNHNYSVSGLVVDERSGERIMNASVYLKEQLVAVLTDVHGYFRLNFKMNNPSPIIVTASKRLYRDTTIHFLQTVLVDSRSSKDAHENLNRKDNRVERTGLGRLFISTRQKIQSLNIPDFFAKRPFQLSLSPGLSTHGMFSSQVVNKFSLNLTGGYTAGVNGVELGGLFNINKRDSKYMQLAGVFNLVGGSVTGLQLAGVHNRALDTVKGVQLALFSNNAGEQLSGLQISALHNETHRLKGVQIGLVNIADTSEGASIGLINIIHNGFYRISLSSNDLMNTNISLKTGTHSFYSVLLVGTNISSNNKIYAFGLGIGHDFMFSKSIYVSAETNYQFANTGSWDDRWKQGKLLLNVQVSKNVALFAGPTYNIYSYTGSQPGYQEKFKVSKNYPPDNSNPVKRWVGWEAGLTFNSVFKPSIKYNENSQAWYLGLAALTGIGWDQPYGLVTGTELFMQRDLNDRIVGTLSIGYTNNQVNKPNTIGSSYYLNGTSIIGYFNSYKSIPLKAGIRTYLNKRLFIGGEVGVALGINSPENQVATDAIGNQKNISFGSKNSLIYSPSLGYSFDNGIETGIKFEDYTHLSNIKEIAFRLAYRLKLNK